MPKRYGLRVQLDFAWSASFPPANPTHARTRCGVARSLINFKRGHADFAGVRAFEQAQAVKVVALNDQVGRARPGQRRQAVRIVLTQARQHDVGV